MRCVIATFYCLTPLPDCAALQPAWKRLLLAHGVTGTLIVAPEGVNATLAGSRAGVDAVLAALRTDARLAQMTHKESFAERNPFLRTKVKLKKETIGLGVPVDPTRAGTYVAPKDWDALLARPDVVVVDTRNDYEVKLGQFKGALNPATRNFKQLPAWLAAHVPDKRTPVAMYCTGGIRCEKSTAYLKAQGYAEVYHLEGGILKYLEEIPAANSSWEGACYVFDDRVAVLHDLRPATDLQNCPGCGQPVNAAELKRHFQAGCGRTTPAKAHSGQRSAPILGVA